MCKASWGVAVAVVAVVAGCGPILLDGGGGDTGSCGPGNCAGCCDSFGVCMPGNTLQSCGLGGAACSPCGDTAGLCLNNGACGIDASLTLRFRVYRAVVAGSNNGAAWDGDNSGPDPRVTMMCPGSDPSATFTQPEVSDSFNPLWLTGGCVATAGELLSQGARFTFDDVDIVSDDSITPYASVAIPYDAIALAEATGGAQFSTAGVGGIVSLDFVVELVR